MGKYFNEIGVILSYLGMLLACYVFDWKPFGIFISYLLEVVALLLVYAVLRMRDQKRNPAYYRNAQPLINVFSAMFLLFTLQYMLISWMTNFIDPQQNAMKQNLLLTKEAFLAIGTTLVLYTLRALQIANHTERIRIFQSNFLFSVLVLSATNIVGFALVTSIENISLLPVLTAMVVVRIGFEFYFGKRMRLV